MYANAYGQPAAGYQVGPPGATYGVTQQQTTYTTQTYVAAASPTSPVPQGVDAELYRLFQAADTDNSGQLSEKELGRALVNGDYTAFDIKTVKLMVNMFDVDR
jgi:peflin